MKTKEAPEKLYLLSNGLISYCRNTDEDVEYTRTDAFIKKAETYLKEKFAKDVSVLAGGAVHINFETAINNFINYMKGE
jgi:hypothetical protein